MELCHSWCTVFGTFLISSTLISRNETSTRDATHSPCVSMCVHEFIKGRRIMNKVVKFWNDAGYNFLCNQNLQVSNSVVCITIHMAILHIGKNRKESEKECSSSGAGKIT